MSNFNPETCEEICELIVDTVAAWVDHTDEVECNWEQREKDGEERILFILSGHAEDVGKMIGYEGQNAMAFRQVIRQIARKNGFKAEFQVEQPAGWVKETKQSKVA